MATLEDFRAWWDRDLGRYAPWQSNVQVLGNVAVDGHNSLAIRIFTDKNRYSIKVTEPKMIVVKGVVGQRVKLSIAEMEFIIAGKNEVLEVEPDGQVLIYPAVQKLDDGYLGCIATSRRWRAGEDHHRGSDLKDGPFTEATWHAILADMLAYELVNIAKDVREPRAPDAVPQPLHDGRGPYSHTEVNNGIVAITDIHAGGGRPLL